MCLVWTANGKTLISGSWDSSIRTWNTKTWKQTAVLDAHTSCVWGIAISPNGRILASASGDQTARLWNLDIGQPISSPLQHADDVTCVSFSADGKLLATGSWDNNTYTWDVATIVKEVGLDGLMLDPKLALCENATRRPVRRRQPAHRVPQGFFDDPREHSHFSPRSRLHSSSAPQGGTFFSRLFHRSPSYPRDTSPTPLDWTQNILKWRGRSNEAIELHGRSPPVVEVPYAQGKRRNASAREKRKKKSSHTTLGSSRPPKPNATQQSSGATQTQPSSQPQPPVSNSSPTPAIGDTTAATTSTPSRPDVMLRQAGYWTRFWLFICCTSPEYIDGHH